MAVGGLFPIVASLVEVIRLGQSINSENILTAYLTIPLALKVLGPFVLGFTAVFIARLNLARLRDQENYTQLLLENAEDLKKQNQALVELNGLLDNLVYSASHDLKTPVVNFKGLISMLRDVKDQPNSEEMVNGILDKLDISSDRFLSTISDLLDVSQVADDAEESKEEIDIRQVVTEVVNEMAYVIESTQAQVDIDTAGASKIFIQEGNLRSVLHNLIGNAIKYAQPGITPKVMVRSHISEGRLAISVTDNGVGIDLEKYKGKLFKMFSRLNNSNADGNGIGLFLVKRTVEKLGGEVAVESRPGAGSTFQILFPENFIVQA